MDAKADSGGYLTAKEIGAYLSLDADTVLAWARQGRIPFVRFSRKIVRFRMADIVADMEVARSSTAVAQEHRAALARRQLD